MNIPELKDFFDRGEVKALSKDRIKIGCAEFERLKVAGYASFRGVLSGPGDAIIYESNPYWVTRTDCERLLKLMDAYQEPHKPFFKPGQKIKAGYGRRFDVTLISFREKFGASEMWLSDEGVFCFHTDGSEAVLPVEPKFKVGDWVRCSRASHTGENPFCVTSEGKIDPEPAGHLYYGNDPTDAHFGPEPYSGCREEWLEAVPPPDAKPEPKTFYKAGDLVQRYGGEVRLEKYVCSFENRAEGWRDKRGNDVVVYPAKDPILERDGRKPTWRLGTCVEYPASGASYRLTRFIGFGETIERWDAVNLQNACVWDWGGIPIEWRVIPDPEKAKQEILTGPHWNEAETGSARRGCYMPGSLRDLDLRKEVLCLRERLRCIEEQRRLPPVQKSGQKESEVTP